MKKIWQKSEHDTVNKIVQKYTTGNDYLLDMQLLPYDIKASLAHGKMLHKI
jgi:argininosuccinate lyase